MSEDIVQATSSLSIAPESSMNSSDAVRDQTATNKADDQIITPWEVQGAKVDGKLVAIDYDRLIEKFGTRKIDAALIERLEKLTGVKAHPFLRRGLFFSHRYDHLMLFVLFNLWLFVNRELNIILDRYEKGKTFYLYTGRGPSSGSMHTGHMIPFLFCK